MPKSRLLSMLAILIASMSGTVMAQEPYEYVWANRLMNDFRYEDMAEKIFMKLSRDSRSERSLWGTKGLAQLKRRQAVLADSLDDRAKFNDECLAMYRKVSKSMKRGSLQYYETLFDLAATIQDVVSEDIRFIQQGRFPADKLDEVRKRNENRLAEAAQIYERAAATLESMTDDEKAQTLSKRAALDKNVVRLLKAELIGTDPKKLKSPFRNEALADAVEELENFGLFNPNTLWEMYSYIWLGRVHAALYEGSYGDADVNKAHSSYWYVFTSLTVDGAEDFPHWAAVINQAVYWDFEFLNKHGATDLLIASGDEWRKRFKELGFEYDYNGRMALIELGRAYQAVGRSPEALDIAAEVSARGGYPGQEADKLMSLIIRTAENKERFKSEVLASGANGAWVAARKNPEKYSEAINLYQIVLLNLDKVEDEVQRNILGRQAYYRIGKCNDKLGRSLEAYIALEQAYKKYNNDKLGDNPKINQEIAKYWRAVATDIVRASGKSAFAEELRNRCNDWIIANQPKGVAGGSGDVMRLLWDKAMGQFRSKSYQDALKSFETIAKKPSEYQERAMVKVAVITATLLRKNKDATAPQWRAAARKFEDFIAYVAASQDEDPLRLKARKAALVEAHFQLSECLVKAAAIEQDLKIKSEDYAKARPHAEFVLKRTKDQNVQQHARYNILLGLVDTGKGVEAYEQLQEMLKADPEHKVVYRAALKVSNALRKAYKAMPRDTEEDVAKRDKLRLMSVRAYRAYLLHNPNPRKLKEGYWPRAISGLYELEKWEEAEELIDRLLKSYGPRLSEKMRRYANRRKARCILERAKKAFAEGRTEDADRLFAIAAPVYAALVGADNKGTNDTLAEAAQIFGGFLTEEDRRGRRKFYPGNSEFARAAKIWKKLQTRFRRAADKATSAAETAKLEHRVQEARVYTFLMVYQDAKSRGDRKGLQRLKRNVEAVFQKSAVPGGPKLVGLWEWLREQF